MALSVEVRLQKTKGWDWRELEQLAYDIGYRFLRHNGTSHRKYFHRLTNDTLVIPTNKDLRRTDAGIIGQLRECWERINMVEEPIIDWKQKIREIRVLKGMSMRQVGDQMGIGMQTVFEIEKKNRLFKPSEWIKWCSVMGLDPKHEKWVKEFRQESSPLPGWPVPVISLEDVPELIEPIEQPLPPKFEVATVVKYDSDIITGGELALARYRELEKLMHDAERYRAEFERLKLWVAEGNKILGV